MQSSSDQPKRGPSDATDYSSTKAPETQQEAEEQRPHYDDWRLIPGGAHGAPLDTGMSSLNRGAAIGGVEDVPARLDTDRS